MADEGNTAPADNRAAATKPGSKPVVVAIGSTPAAGFSEAALHRQAIEQVAPPNMLVDDSHRVTHLSENVGRFVLPSGGPLSGDAVDLVRPELRFELRSALNRAFDQRLPTLSLPILVRFNGTPHRVHLLVKPVLGESPNEPRTAVVMFIEGEAVDSTQLPADQTAADETVQRLTQELELTQGRLRTVREESEAANEELRAANEELQSINEEYRSTSEELETSQEELQSINEELQTVNGELKLKLEVVSRAHSDLQNLVAATEIATLFLDSSLRIKRFTDRVADLFSITPSDEGRPITDFARRLEYDDLVKDAQAVLTNLAPIRREIRSRDARWYDVRLRPYRTLDDKIDGVVITFVDVSERHEFERALQESERQQRLLQNELTRRSGSILGVVQEIARQALHGSQAREQLIGQFEDRLSALVGAHNLLVQSGWKGADLAELARQELQRVYAFDTSDRVRIEGEAFSLPPDLVMPVGLILHRLAANAVIHGALSALGGKIAVTWSVLPQNNQGVLKITWRETNRGAKRHREGKPETGPGESAIPGVQIKEEWLADGFACTIELGLQQTATPDTGAAG